ncbi:MAG: TonB-dependent receptor [Candidatus Wallbacteria bacterium]|nr:TonB-dependent receptor [Candidatus Wallbacteria bacterium]
MKMDCSPAAQGAGSYRESSRGRLGLAILICLAGPLAWPTPGNAGPSRDLTSLELEELMQVRITSASKKQQRLREAPAAIYVLTSADIHRSGATNLPDLLRLVPGLEVARIDASKWAVTARGFNGRFANKLLVLVDGRSVYTPLFSGVYWDVQDVPMEDIDRVEIVRGPGGALYGANAVNGVINVITKRARDTQGGLATALGGSEERFQGLLRYGGQAGDDSWYRVYGKGSRRDNSADLAGAGASDGWIFSQAGFRVDTEPNRRDRLTVQGDFYDGKALGLVNSVFATAPFVRATSDDRSLQGGNLTMRLERRYSVDEDMAAQLYYDRTQRDKPTYRQGLDMIDADFQHRRRYPSRHELIWGAGFRLMADEILSTDILVSLSPTSRDTRIFSAFVQDEYRFPGDKLRLTLGSKVEHNSYTGVEVQPNLRLMWLPDARETVWAAVSRAVRTPARIEDDGRISQRPFAGPKDPTDPAGLRRLTVIPTLVGNRAIDSEELLAREVGWRFEASDRLSLDAAAFYNTYRQLRTLEPAGPAYLEASPAPVHLILPFAASNGADADTWGLELATDWHAAEGLRLRSGCTFLRLSIDPALTSRDATARAPERENPNHQLFLSTYWDMSKDVQLDGHLRWVDALPGLGVPSYLTLDLRLAWKLRPNTELALVGRDLLDASHSEFTPTSLIDTQATQVERGWYGKVTWQF